MLRGRLAELAIVIALCSTMPACGHEAAPPSPVAPCEHVLVDPVWSCAWSVETTDAWITVDQPRPGEISRGDGPVVYTVPPNPSTQPRQAVLVVGEKRLTITQHGRQ